MKETSTEGITSASGGSIPGEPPGPTQKRAVVVRLDLDGCVDLPSELTVIADALTDHEA
jgi:hypothetical protein